MRAFADPAVDTVVFMSAAQMGKTELQFNVLAWMWDTAPRPSIFVVPTQKLAYTMSRDRISNMLASVPGLSEKVDRRFNKPGSLERWINGARFGLAWAGSATELAAHPAAMVLVDERDRMTEDIAGEGDPVRLAQARTKNYVGSKVGVFSTPTSEGTSAIYDWWASGTAKRWCWECPGCGHWFPPEMQHVRYPEKADYPTVRAEAHIACPECEHEIRSEDREHLGAAYIPYIADESGTFHQARGLESINSVDSYAVTGFASPFVTIGEIAEHWVRAARDGGPGDMQAVVNTHAGELWREPGEGTAAESVKDCQTDAIGDVQLVTAGVDVQQDSLYYVVRGWGANSESWLLGHGQLLGATEYDDVWMALQRVLEDQYCGLSVRMALIDSGYNTAQVYEWTRRVASWSPSKGVARQDRPFKDSSVDERATGAAVKFGIKLWSFCADTWKTWLYARIKWPDGQPGGWHVPAGIDDEYCAQVTNERVRISRGRREWYRTGNQQNHYLDCEVLAAVAAHIQNVRTLKVKPAPKAKPKKSEPSEILERQRRINARREAERDPFERSGL